MADSEGKFDKIQPTTRLRPYRVEQPSLIRAPSRGNVFQNRAGVASLLCLLPEPPRFDYTTIPWCSACCRSDGPGRCHLPTSIIDTCTYVKRVKWVLPRLCAIEGLVYIKNGLLEGVMWGFGWRYGSMADLGSVWYHSTLLLTLSFFFGRGELLNPFTAVFLMFSFSIVCHQCSCFKMQLRYI